MLKILFHGIAWVYGFAKGLGMDIGDSFLQKKLTLQRPMVNLWGPDTYQFQITCGFSVPIYKMCVCFSFSQPVAAHTCVWGVLCETSFLLLFFTDIVYWQETWNFIFFGYPDPNFFWWLQKLKKLKSKSIFQGKTSQTSWGWLNFVELLLYHSWMLTWNDCFFFTS